MPSSIIMLHIVCIAYLSTSLCMHSVFSTSLRNPCFQPISHVLCTRVVCNICFQNWCSFLPRGCYSWPLGLDRMRQAHAHTMLTNHARAKWGCASSTFALSVRTPTLLSISKNSLSEDPTRSTVIQTPTRFHVVFRHVFSSLALFHLAKDGHIAVVGHSACFLCGLHLGFVLKVSLKCSNPT